MSAPVFVFRGPDGVWRPSPGEPHAGPPEMPPGLPGKRGVCGSRGRPDDVFSAEVHYMPDAPAWGWVDAQAWPPGA